MSTRRSVGTVLAACVFAVTTSLAPSAAAITKTTDNTDLWWIHTESGWGIQLVQNHNTIFATLFVYGPDNQPTWYTATLPYQGSGVWSGGLYKTTGPWFGAGVFDPSTVTASAVGTMSVTPGSIATATLAYTVNGVSVTKAIERQLLALENFSGSYAAVYGQQAGTGTGCNAADAFDALPASVQITQSSSAMTLVIVANGDTCSFAGSYSQTGHFGRAFGSYTCTSGASGTFDFFEMVRTHADFRARTSITKSGCTIKGRMIGLEQPLPPQ
jgi:hypothetical protein